MGRTVAGVLAEPVTKGVSASLVTGGMLVESMESLLKGYREHGDKLLDGAARSTVASVGDAFNLRDIYEKTERLRKDGQVHGEDVVGSVMFILGFMEACGLTSHPDWDEELRVRLLDDFRKFAGEVLPRVVPNRKHK